MHYTKIRHGVTFSALIRTDFFSANWNEAGENSRNLPAVLSFV
jgi:hypothetical protein